jgi:hypothetical protein
MGVPPRWSGGRLPDPQRARGNEPKMNPHNRGRPATDVSSDRFADVPGAGSWADRTVDGLDGNAYAAPLR